MPELLEIGDVVILGGLDPERGVAPRAAASGDVVLHLGRRRLGEELLEHLVGASDERFIEAVLADAHEAIAAQGLTEIGDERLTVGVGALVEATDV
jgi:hypothetical protein